MNFGHFDAAAREYVITRPDTPRPWSNYLGSRLYGGIITQHAGGYSFSRSPASGRILRHRYNSVPADLPGRQFYVRDRATGDHWSAAWQTAGKPDNLYQTSTRFGTGYAIITSAYSGIRMQSAYFVPLDSEFEVWHLRVTNESRRLRSLSVFSFCEFTSEWNLVNDLLNLQYTQYIARCRWEVGFLVADSCHHLPERPDDFSVRDQSRHWWMTQLGGVIRGRDADRECFLGPWGDFRSPAAVVRGQCTDSDGVSDNICGAIQSDLELGPGESADVIVLLGIGHAAVEGRAAVAACGTTAGAASALHALRGRWHSVLDAFQCETPDKEFDHMVNTWGAYNALMTFEWSRSCSLIYTGDQRDGFGFRDTVQDCLGVTGMIPSEVRERLLLMLSAQDATGGAQPEVRPWSHQPGRMPPTPADHYRSDDCLWFFNTIPAYVDETGDEDFYDVSVPFADAGEATVLGHLRRALEFNLERTGAHGLPCGLSADWNDCLKLGYRGESLFVAFQLRLGLVTYRGIAARKGLASEVDWAEARLADLDGSLRRVAWDGSWFRWAIGEDGTVFGTSARPEGQVYLNTQAWAILSGSASPEQAAMALQAVRSRLAGPWGVALCDPPFATTGVEVMRAVLFNPGNKENAGIFSHTQSWAVLAELAAGTTSKAWEYYRAFLPSAQNDRAEIREIEPFVHCQSTHSRHSPKEGRSRVPWLSGTASWAHDTAVRHLLGIRPEVDGLRIDPRIPAEWPGFKVRRRFRGRQVQIEVLNPGHLDRGIGRLEIDGRRLDGNVAPLGLLQDGTRIVARLEALP